MKKLLLSGILSLLAIGLYSNPNPDPQVYLNELMFTGTNGWNIELFFYYCELNSIDSITVHSGSGTARVINFHYGQCFYFTDQDLSQPLAINPNGDSICIRSYRMGWIFTCHGFAFGNIQNSVVLSPKPGTSIERFEHTNCWYPYYPSIDVYTLCKHPTMGMPNDTTGTCGTVQGYVFNQSGQPVPNQAFQMDFPFTTDASGHFSTRIFSRIANWDTLCYQRWTNYFLPVKISPISYTTVPDSLISRDIFLLSPIIVGTDPRPLNRRPDFNVFPNPVNDLITLSYASNLLADPDDLNISIYDVSGKIVFSKLLENRLGVESFPLDLTNGLYLASLTEGGTVIGSARFIVSRSK